jgi:hypothetical protein
MSLHYFDEIFDGEASVKLRPRIVLSEHSGNLFKLEVSLNDSIPSYILTKNVTLSELVD